MASALVLLLAVGLLAIGASGLLSVAFRATLGDRFVAADLPGVTYTAARCRDFEEYHPEQPTCDRAAAAHHADEVESYRIAAGLLGAVVLAGWWLVRRRHRDEQSVAWLPDEMVPLVGLIVFGGAALGLGVQSANARRARRRQRRRRPVAVGRSGLVGGGAGVRPRGAAGAERQERGGRGLVPRQRPSPPTGGGPR